MFFNYYHIFLHEWSKYVQIFCIVSNVLRPLWLHISANKKKYLKCVKQKFKGNWLATLNKDRIDSACWAKAERDTSVTFWKCGRGIRQCVSMCARCCTAICIHNLYQCPPGVCVCLCPLRINTNWVYRRASRDEQPWTSWTCVDRIARVQAFLLLFDVLMFRLSVTICNNSDWIQLFAAIEPSPNLRPPYHNCVDALVAHRPARGILCAATKLAHAISNTHAFSHCRATRRGPMTCNCNTRTREHTKKTVAWVCAIVVCQQLFEDHIRVHLNCGNLCANRDTFGGFGCFCGIKSIVILEQLVV